MSGELHAIDLEVGSNEIRLLRLMMLLKVNSGTSVAAPEAGFSGDQGWQASPAPLFLQRLDLFFQTGRRRSHDIVPGDVDAGDQALLGESRFRE